MRTKLGKPVFGEGSRAGGGRRSRIVALMVLALVCLIPAVGFVRERHDNLTKQRMYRESREDIERELPMLREGDPGSRLRELLPELIKRSIKTRDRVIFDLVTGHPIFPGKQPPA